MVLIAFLIVPWPTAEGVLGDLSFRCPPSPGSEVLGDFSCVKSGSRHGTWSIDPSPLFPATENYKNVSFRGQETGGSCVVCHTRFSRAENEPCVLGIVDISADREDLF